MVYLYVFFIVYGCLEVSKSYGNASCENLSCNEYRIRAQFNINCKLVNIELQAN